MDIKNYIFNVSAVTLGICALLILALAIIPVRISKRGILNIFKILIVSLSAFSFFAEPKPSTDLYRYYVWLEGLNEYVSRNRVLVVWNFIMRTVKLTGNHGFLPAGCVMLWGYMVFKFLKEYLNKNEYSSQAVFLYFISLFSGCGLYYIISGLRSTLIAAIIAYAYYVVRGKNKPAYYLLIAASAFIHIFALMLFMIIEVYEKFIKVSDRTAIFKMLLAVLIISFFINSDVTVRLFRLIPGEYGNLLALKWNAYIHYDNMYSMENSFRIFYIGFFVVFTFIKLIRERKIDFFDWLILVMAAASPMVIFFERLPYLMGICSLTAINDFIVNSKAVGRFIYKISLYIISCLFLFFFVYTMFAHINFNGHSYYEFWHSIVY